MSISIIAEIGSTHDGSFGNALNAIDATANMGVDAVKFQTHIADAETLENAPQPPYFKGEPRFEYFERTGFSLNQWKELKDKAIDRNVEFLSSPFSIASVELLEELGVHKYKIPSGEVTNIPMLEFIAKTKKPVLLSSGMSSWAELDLAVATIKRYHNDITVLQCTTEYPCPPQNVGLNVINEMRGRYNLPVGLSDHTNTMYAAILAVSYGISAIEKHFTFSQLMYGSDAKHSMEPHQFSQMIEGIRAAEKMTTNLVNKDDISKYSVMKETFEKSLVSLQKIPAGSTITRAMIGEKKPGTGIPPKRLEDIMGQIATETIEENTLISYKQVGLSP